MFGATIDNGGGYSMDVVAADVGDGLSRSPAARMESRKLQFVHIIFIRCFPGDWYRSILIVGLVDGLSRGPGTGGSH